MKGKHFWFTIALIAMLGAIIMTGGCAPAAPTAAPTQVPATSAPAATAAPVATVAPAATAATAATAAPVATKAPEATKATEPTKAAAVDADVAFYNGKTITFIVATKAGGGYDTYARTLAPYLQKYLPGSTVIIKNVPGAGHIIGTNELNLAKPDGLTIGTFNTALIFGQIVGTEGIKFDLTKFSWLAKMSSDNRVLMVSTKSPYKTFDDLLKASATKPIVMATNGPTSAAHVDALLVQEATGLKIKTISGYQGNDGDLAILRGEVDGEVGSYGSLKHFIDSGDGRFLLQIGKEKVAGLTNIPLVSEVTKPEKKAMGELLIANASLGRLVAAPPGIPEARRQALIQAIKKAAVDPEFLATAKKQDLEIEPAYGDDVAKLVTAALAQNQADLALLKEILGPAAQGN